MGAPMMPRPIKPTFMFSCSWRAQANVRRTGRTSSSPATVVALRPVFAADPAAIAHPVERREDERIVDLAGARLVAAGIVGELDVGDPILEPLEGGDEIALRELRVVEVVLELEIVGADLVDDLDGLRRPAQVEARDVEGVDRLDQESNTRPLASSARRSARFSTQRRGGLAPARHPRAGCRPDS